MSNLVEHLYQDHHEWLYHWLCQKIQNHQSAEDIVQDTFEKLLCSQELNHIQYPKSFLAQIASRIVIDQARRRQIEQAYLDYLAVQEIEHDLGSPESILIAIELLDRIAQMLAGLDEQVRQIFLLKYIDSLTQAEIAEKLQITRRTVQMALIKALQHCDTILHS